MEENEVFEMDEATVEETTYEEPELDSAPSLFTIPTAIAVTIGGAALGAIGARVAKPLANMAAEKTQGLRKSLRDRKKKILEDRLSKIYEAEATEE